MIVKTFSNSRVGNDCLIQDTVLLLCVDGIYHIMRQTRYIGGWCSDKPRLATYVASDEQDAHKIFNRVVKEVI